jgi:hypothetical protein
MPHAPTTNRGPPISPVPPSVPPMRPHLQLQCLALAHLSLCQLPPESGHLGLQGQSLQGMGVWGQSGSAAP